MSENTISIENIKKKPSIPSNIDKLDEEIEEGNIEYKWRLTGFDQDKQRKITFQMKWRLEEGEGIAIYYLGVRDNGKIDGLSESDMTESFNFLKKSIEECDAHIKSETLSSHKTGLYIRVEIEKNHKKLSFDEVKVIVLGDTGTGKSTLISVLTYDDLDNGDGSARMKILLHKHELKSGNTSSITQSYVGVDENNTYISCKNGKKDIISKSKKIITFIDTPGDKKCRRTLLYALSSYQPDHALIVQNDNKMNDIYVQLCQIYQIPYTVIQTKKDLTDNVMKPNIFNVSLKTSDGLPDIIKHITNLNKRKKSDIDVLMKHINKSFIDDTSNIFIIHEVFNLIDSDPILYGTVLRGDIHVGNKLYIIDDMSKKDITSTHEVTVSSIKIKHYPTDIIKEGETGSIMIKITENGNMKDKQKQMIVSKYDILISDITKLNNEVSCDLKIDVNDKNSSYLLNILNYQEYINFKLPMNKTTDENKINPVTEKGEINKIRLKYFTYISSDYPVVIYESSESNNMINEKVYKI